MSENIENLKSVLKIRILANIYHPNNPRSLGELFQEMILRNPQALYISRNLEKFKNSIKIHFLFAKLLQFSTILKKGVQGRKSSYWLNFAHAFTSYPKL